MSTNTKADRLSAFLKKASVKSFPIPLAYVYEPDLITFTKTNSLGENLTTVILWSLYTAFMHLDGVDYNSFLIGTKKITDPVDVKDDPKPFTKDQALCARRLLDNHCEIATNYLVELVGATQVDTLSEKNIESYFASFNVEVNATVIGKLLPGLSAGLSQLSDHPDFQKRMKASDWLRYHTTFASGSGLVMRVCEATGTTDQDSGPFKVPATVLASIKKSLENPWNKQAADEIPMTLKGICHVYLEALNMLPSGKWYQGEKGRSYLSPAAISAIKAYAVRTTALKADTKSIDSADSVQAANKIVRDNGAVPSIS